MLQIPLLKGPIEYFKGIFSPLCALLSQMNAYLLICYSRVCAVQPIFSHMSVFCTFKHEQLKWGCISHVVLRECARWFWFSDICLTVKTSRKSSIIEPNGLERNKLSGSWPMFDIFLLHLCFSKQFFMFRPSVVTQVKCYADQLCLVKEGEAGR